MSAYNTDDGDDDRRSDLAVMDANEYKQKRRLKRILEAVENVEERANEAWELLVLGEINQDAKNIMIQRAVQQAIREVYVLLVDDERSARENGKSHSEYWAGSQDDPLGTLPRNTDADKPIYGLYHFLELEPYYTEIVTETISRPQLPPQTETKTREFTVPEELSWEAFLRLKEFLNDQHDLEISFEEIDTMPSWGMEETDDDDELPESVEVV